MIYIQGAEQYSAYSGYGYNLKFAGNFIDPSPRDIHGAPTHVIIAMDAIASPAGQFQNPLYARDVLKAFVGFSGFSKFQEPVNSPTLSSMWETNSVATGNWGCGGRKKKIKK